MKQMMFFSLISRSSCQFAHFIVSKYALPETKFGLRGRDQQESVTVNAGAHYQWAPVNAIV